MSTFKKYIVKARHIYIYMKRLCVGGEQERSAKFFQLRPFELHEDSENFFAALMFAFKNSFKFDVISIKLVWSWRKFSASTSTVAHCSFATQGLRLHFPGKNKR